MIQVAEANVTCKVQIAKKPTILDPHSLAPEELFSPLCIHLATPKTIPGLLLGSFEEPSLHRCIALLTATAAFLLCVVISLAPEMLILTCTAERY